jgi:hypothetical protein
MVDSPKVNEGMGVSAEMGASAEMKAFGMMP